MNDSAALSEEMKLSLCEHGKALSVAFEVVEGGLTPEFYAKLDKHFKNADLVKIRFRKAARPKRAALIAHVVKNGGCQFVASDEMVALFHRRKAKGGRS